MVPVGEGIKRQGSKRTTLQSIALRAGVSKTTASLILNRVEGEKFSAETRSRVIEAAKALDYPVRPRRRNVGSRMVAFVHPSSFAQDQLAHSYYGPIIGALSEEAARLGYHLMVALGLSSPEQQLEYVRSEMGERLDGLVLGGMVSKELLCWLRETGRPMVLAGNDVEVDQPCHQVVGDDVMGGYLAGRHLLELGHRRIAFLGYLNKREYYRRRLSGLGRALFESSVALNPAWVVNVEEEAAVESELRRVFQGPERPTALLAGNHHLSSQAMESLSKLGLSVPQDVSLVGYQTAITARLWPVVTYVEMSETDTGLLAMRRLLELIENPDTPPAILTLPARLVVRQSTAALQPSGM